MRRGLLGNQWKKQPRWGVDRRALAKEDPMASHRIYKMSFVSVYPHYVAKAEKKGRKKEEVDQIIKWLTGYGQKELNSLLGTEKDFATFFA